MRKFITCFKSVISIFLISFITISGTMSTARAEEKCVQPDVSAQSYVLYCSDNGKIICSSDENRKMKPASTTKLMTTLITLEEAASADRQVKFTKDMIAEGSSMYLQIGDRLRLSDLASGMMMASGNDAANAAAISISGSSEKFAQKMNERAKQIGMKNTHFVTPSGLDNDNHYSTAYDMALLMSFALENEDFAKLTSQKSITVNFIEPQSKKTTYANHNRLLSMYEYCNGGKTGYTMAAGRCLVSSAKKNGLTLICVTLNDRNDWEDHISLYEYGFGKYSYYNTDDEGYCVDVDCVGGDSDKIAVVGENNGGFVVLTEDREKVKRKVYADSFLYAPVLRNEIVGRIDYMLDDKVLYSTNLIAVSTVNSDKENKNIFTIIKDFFTYG